MFLLPVVLGAGVGLGYARGGRLARLADLPLRAPLVLVAGLGAQAVAGVAPGLWRPALVGLSYGVIGAWLLLGGLGAHRRLRLPAGLVLAGWALNAAAVLPNGGMPVPAGAPGPTGPGLLGKHIATGPSTALPWFGDVLAAPPLGAVVSAGDLVLFAGLVLLVSRVMRGRA
ncbi:MAG: DUF5317 family protein [Acidimicrobiales bacterium]